ncbi:MAG: sulfatase-like hydrolase/transferase, partial [Candidatus Hydrogenedentes bacterium]|nr:sulfatase-like hydrolase/transferase [Candidatus Hydrogenedentota bacterium]
PDFPYLDTDRADRVMAEYLASVSGVDRNVGRLLNTLDELGLRENTVVIFTSDHGYNVGHHGVLHKGNAHWLTNWARGKSGPEVVRPNLWDSSLRTPTAIRWPGVIAPGTKVDDVVTNLDWFPTILAMTDVDLPPPLTIHGRNFLPLLDGNSAGWDNEMYAEYSIHHYKEADLRAWRTPEWKLVRDFRNEGHDELYHLLEDPDERENLIGDPKYATIQDDLERKLLARMQAIKDPVLGRKD